MNKSYSPTFFTILYFLASLASLILLIANPGYYSHDELQKMDHVLRYGLSDYLNSYLAIRVGDEFGTPIRPVSFLVQGLLALSMDDYPIVVHLFAVLTHILNGYLLHLVLIHFGMKRNAALLVAYMFVIFPTSIIATGWSAALMDRLYLLFGLITFIFVLKYIEQPKRTWHLIFIFIFSTLSILSKETAMMLPAAMLAIVAINHSTFLSRNFWIAGIIWSTPIIIFILYRLSAISNSFGGESNGAYHASIDNVFSGLIVYFSYPFLINLTEAINWVFISKVYIGTALLIHTSVAVLIGIVFGRRWSAFYAISYIIFLLPILLIPIKAAHYLYASGVFLAIAVTFLLTQKNLIIRSYAVILSILLVTHSLHLQKFIYDLGKCMSNLNLSASSSFISSGSPDFVSFVADEGAPEHVLHRFITGRQQIGPYYPVQMEVKKIDEASGETIFNMNSSCVAYRK